MFYDGQYRILYLEAFFVSFFALLGVTTIYLPVFVMSITVIFALFSLIFIKPLAGLILIIISTFLTNITITIDSPVREAFEILHFAIIPIAVIYLLLLPRIIQYIKFCDKHEKQILLQLIFFYGWAILSFFWSHDKFHGVNVLTTFLVSIFVFQLVSIVIRDKDTLIKLLNIMPVLGLVLGMMLLASKFYSELKFLEIFKDVNLNFILITDHSRPGGFAPPDFAAAIMNVFIFINIALMYKASSFKRIALGFLIFFLASCMLLTASKAAAGSFFLGVMLLIFIMPFFRKYLIRLLISLFSVMFVLLIIGGSVLVRRIKLLIEKDVPGGGLGERLEWWAIGFDKLWDTFGIGLGIGGYLKYIDPVPGVHNFYFSILFDLGVIGFFIFIIIIVSLISYVRKVLITCKDNEMIFIIYCFIANLAVFGTQALVEGDFQQTTAWLLLALMLTVLKVAAKTVIPDPMAI